MKVKDVIKELKLNLKTAGAKLDSNVTGGYASDLLSDVMANAQDGCLWITLQIHPNIIAVASMKDMAGIIIVNGREPEPETIKRADSEGINLMVSKMSAFEVAGNLYKIGIKGVSK